uniref:Uncharacterized protein n=1 Tax=Rhizophagus irregularis (strain DAOM 181602 / DAOM 197198 / MUCL 43194) TaxID=747089 RepID=U9TCL7_RHIID
MSTITISGTPIRLYCLAHESNSAFYVTTLFSTSKRPLRIRNKTNQGQIKATSIDDMSNEENKLEVSGLKVEEVFRNTRGNSVRVIVKAGGNEISM